MTDLFWLTDEQVEPLRPFFPQSQGKPWVDDRRVLSGIVFVNRNGLRWRDALSAPGPHKTLYSRWKRWEERGVFLRMMEGLAAADAEPNTVMVDATYLKADRTASSLRVRKGSWTTDRPHERRHKHQAPRRRRCERPPFELLHDRWPGPRLQWRGSDAGRPA
jgi:transposase